LSEVTLEKKQDSSTLSVLPLRDVVVFPNMVIPLFVGREKSIIALDSAMSSGKEILLVAQKRADIDEPSIEDLHEIGTLSKILQLLKLPDGTVKVLVEGSKRIKVLNLKFDECFTADYINLQNNDSDDREIDILSRALVSQFEQYLKLNKKIPPEVLTSISGIDDACKLSDTITAHIPLKLNEKQKILEIADVKKRLEHLLEVIQGEIDVLQVEKQVRGRVKSQMEKSQREYYLNEQMKAIQSELGDIDNTSNDLTELETKINESGMTKDASTKATSELKKLKMMSPMSAEASVIRNYLECLLKVPWKKKSKVLRDIVKAENILNEDHFGLEKVKERILEYLAVQQRVNKLKGPILCLVGPPGVGKTSLGKSIARATNRKFVRMSLGGVRDEAEIRGHRRTYIGSMPGKIIQNLSKINTKNPLFLLDEIDKMAMDFRGDPSSALLEVLDPEQNHTFADHYLEVDYDLSDVMFVCTANSLDNIPSPLLDRMEIIRISGYTEDEKLNIARKYLLPKQFRENGLKSDELSVNVSAVTSIIQKYTREAGVRSLERAISKVCRKTVKYLLSGTNKKSVKVTSRNLKKYLGVSHYSHKNADNKDQVGQVNGLAWTQVGGEILTIETALVPGKGKLTHTGRLGSVMTESIQAAMTVVRSRSAMFNLKEDFHKIYDLHVHVPEGATPKDGPSAGVGMCTALVSALTDIPVRCDIAMTGEITLRGEVLAIGGLKEKLLAAHRGGIKTVLIPYENEKDLEEIPNNIKGKLEILPVKWIDEVLEKALVHSPVSINQQETKKTEKTSLETVQNREDIIRPH
jgi:ATP-dependent Lon protease